MFGMYIATRRDVGIELMNPSLNFLLVFVGAFLMAQVL
jgi:hypothetical protein